MAEVFVKRNFSEYPYLKPMIEPFRAKVGNILPSLLVFVVQRDNLFGDALPLDLAGLTITFKLYNSSRILISQGLATIDDLDRSLIQYQWQPFDLKIPGTYYGEFTFTDLDDSFFILPEKGHRLEVIVTQ